MIRTRYLLTTLAVIALTPAARAATITLSAVQDTSIQSQNATLQGTNFNTQLIGVFRANPISAGVVAFDLSGITDQIVSARLDYYQVNVQPAGTHVHEVYYNDPADGVGMLNETTLTYAGYQATYGGVHGESATALSLGALSLPADSASGVYHAGGSASAADLTYLNNRAAKANAVDRFAQFLLWRTGTTSTTNPLNSRRVFGDRESGNPVLLVLETVPEPTSAVLILAGAMTAMGAAQRSRHGTHSLSTSPEVET